jgi:hypothetical protein
MDPALWQTLVAVAWLVGSIGVVAGLAGSAGFRRLIWHARVPVGFAILACFALAGPVQTRFLLAGIDSLGDVLALLLAVLLTGVGAWFWARWSLNLAWRADLPGVAPLRDSRWWRLIPRAVAVAPAIAALICLGFSYPMMHWVWIIELGIGLVAVAVLLVVLAWARRAHIQDRRQRGEAGHGLANWVLSDELLAEVPPETPRGLGAWLRLGLACMPFHWLLLLPLIAGFIALIVATQAGASWPSTLAQQAGAAPTALIGLAALLTLLAPSVGLIAAAWRWPALLFLLILIIGAASATVNTLVRADQPLPPRPTLAQAADAWLTSCVRREGDVVRAVIVANAGGASRAALWTAAVMRALETELPAPAMEPGRQLFTISGISGGALGAAAYVATLDQSDVACGGADRTPALRTDRLNRLQAGLGRDFLAPAFTGLFLGDGFWRLFGPASALAGWLGWWPEDRSVRLERAWEAALATPGTEGMAGLLVGRTFGGGEAPRLPLLLTAGTHQESGRLAVTAPVRIAEALPAAIDVLATLDADLPFSVAASNSARFPYVSAPGLLRRRGTQLSFGQIVDGGYYDNQGAVAAAAAATALEAAHARRAATPGDPLAGSRLALFVVQVLSDPDLPPEELPRCDAEEPPATAAESAPTPLDFLTSPVGALVAVRGERANIGATELRRRFCPKDGPGPLLHYSVFSLGADAARIRPPLSWVLSEAVRNSIAQRGLSAFAATGNAEELERLRNAWAAAVK